MYLARKRHLVAAIVENTAQLSVNYNYSFYLGVCVQGGGGG